MRLYEVLLGLLCGVLALALWGFYIEAEPKVHKLVAQYGIWMPICGGPRRPPCWPGSMPKLDPDWARVTCQRCLTHRRSEPAPAVDTQDSTATPRDSQSNT